MNWQLLYEVWSKNQKNLLGISIQASLFKENIPALAQFEKSLIEDYKQRPELVSKSINVDLKEYI